MVDFIHGIIPLSNASALPSGRLPRAASWEGAVLQAVFIFFHVHMLHSNVIQAISSALRFFGCAVGQSVARGVFKKKSIGMHLITEVINLVKKNRCESGGPHFRMKPTLVECSFLFESLLKIVFKTLFIETPC